MHKFPFFSSCMQDLDTIKANFVNEDINTDNNVKTCDEHITSRNLDNYTNKLLSHSSPVVAHESSQQILSNKKMAYTQKSDVKVNKNIDIDAYNDED